MLTRGVPDHIRSDNGPEFIAKEPVVAATDRAGALLSQSEVLA